MIDIVNGIMQVMMFFVFVALLYIIVQVLSVIREERERIMGQSRRDRYTQDDGDLY